MNPVRVSDLVYDADERGDPIAAWFRGAWSKPGRPSKAKQNEWDVCSPAEAKRYDALPILPAVHPVTAALAARGK